MQFTGLGLSGLTVKLEDESVDISYLGLVFNIACKWYPQSSEDKHPWKSAQAQTLHIYGRAGNDQYPRSG